MRKVVVVAVVLIAAATAFLVLVPGQFGTVSDPASNTDGSPTPSQPDTGTPPPDRPATAEEAEVWAFVSGSADPYLFAEYVAAYPDSPYAPLATAWLAERGLTPADLLIAESLEPGAGIEAPDPAAALAAQLRAADIAFNRPDRMRFGEPTTVELVLAPESSGIDAAEALGPDLGGPVREVEGVAYALKTQATLSGPEFTVSPAGPQKKTVLPDRATRWVWTVTPTDHGEAKVLTLSVEAVVERDGTELPPVPVETFVERIVVDVDLWDRVVELSGEIRTVHAAIAGVGGTVVGVLFWLFRRRRDGGGGDKDDRAA